MLSFPPPMERSEDVHVAENESHPVLMTCGDTEEARSSNLYLDHVGEVVLTLNSDKLSWKLVESINKEQITSFCFGISLASKIETEIKTSDIYSVELINWGLIHNSVLPNSGEYLLGRDSEMYRFTVHGYQRSRTQHSLCVLAAYTFGHKDLQICQAWADQVNAYIDMDVRRPRSILVFVHPLSGKGIGRRTWETVAPIFSRANVKTKVTVTERAGQAYDAMASISDTELSSYDGVVAVGGDGFFNEIMNGLLSSRHKAPYPPAPSEVMHSGNLSDCNPNEVEPGTIDLNEDQDPLLQCPRNEGSSPSCLRNGGELCSTDKKAAFSFPNEQFRFGIIPAGSTDAVVIWCNFRLASISRSSGSYFRNFSTTGARDPITSALHIVLGKRVSLDIAQIVRWKTTTFSKDAPLVRYAASFAGYGFYGDVIKESEHFRWMGPKRYDYAGTKVFLKHRSYEAEVSYLENPNPKPPLNSKKPERVICRVNCTTCSDTSKTNHHNNARWLRSKGRYLSVGAAVISNRNGRAPDGLVADAHLSDGFLHLILVKDCPRPFYLWHLTQLAKKGGNPLSYKFVEHHKTRAFTFTSSGDESVWNLDGEMFEAHQLSAQVFRGLVSLFASGPEI